MSTKRGSQGERDLVALLTPYFYELRFQVISLNITKKSKYLNRELNEAERKKVIKCYATDLDGHQRILVDPDFYETYLFDEEQKSTAGRTLTLLLNLVKCFDEDYGTTRGTVQKTLDRRKSDNDENNGGCSQILYCLHQLGLICSEEKEQCKLLFLFHLSNTIQ